MNPPPSPIEPISSCRGQLVVLAMFIVAALAATFAWWWNYNRGNQALEFFGPEGALLIRTAPRVTLLPTDTNQEIDLSQAPGLLNARASLLSDASFQWMEPPARASSTTWAVRFSRGDHSVVVAFDFPARAIHTSSTNRSATLSKLTAEGWQKYLDRRRGAANSETKAATH
jgi:hypothetical protein